MPSLQAKLDQLRAKHRAIKEQPATVKDYTAWLRGYMDRGKEPNHIVDHPFDGDKFYVITRNMEIPTLHGAMAVNLIIPEGVEVSFRDIGHTSLYFMKGYTTTDRSVTVYSDIVFEEK